MLRTMMKSKIHRAAVTQADLHYVGSVTVDADRRQALHGSGLVRGDLHSFAPSGLAVGASGHLRQIRR